MLIQLTKLINILGSAYFFWNAWHFYYSPRFQIGQIGYGDILVILVYCIIQFLLNKTYSAYDIGNARAWSLFCSLCLADGVGLSIYILIMWIGWFDIPNPFPLMAVFGVQVVWNALWSVFVNRLYFRLYKAKKSAIIYKDDSDLFKFREMDRYGRRFEVVKHIKDPADIKSIKKELDGIDAVFVIGIDATIRNELAEYLIDKRIVGYFVPHVGDVILAGARNLHLFATPTMCVSRAELSPEYMALKRVMDVVVSMLGIIILSPVMLITALAVKCCDGGPVFYRQERLTKDRQIFQILKFRSMSVDAEKDGVARLAVKSDSRITPVGRIIRACRLDELPQLFNILEGSMTLVGPRPERPEIAERYEKELPSFALRLQVKAGLTGYAQIYGRYNTHPRDKLQMDLLYINSMSIIRDIRLLFATIKILFQKDSTLGVNEGQTNAFIDKAQEISCEMSGVQLPPYSVLMSVYYKDKAEHFKAAIQSMIDQTVSSDEFVIVCDGPLNDELEKVLSWASATLQEKLKIVRIAENGGLGKALNKGAQFCTNEFVARMDADDISLPNRCELQLRAFLEHPDVSVMSGIIEEFSKDVSLVMARRVLPEKHEEILEFAKSRNPFNHPCVMFRKSAVDRAGGYKDMRLLEDYYLWVQMLLNGEKGMNLPIPLLRMRAGYGMYKRRGGFKYAMSQIRLFSYMKERKMISRTQFLISVTMRSISSLLPAFVRYFLFMQLLRE